MSLNKLNISSFDLYQYSSFGKPYLNPLPLPIGTDCFSPSLTHNNISCALASD